MLADSIAWRSHRTMSPNAFRLSIVVAVVVVSLLGVIAFAVVLASEITDRSVLVLGVILGFLGPTIVALLGILKTDAMGERVQQKVEDVRDFVANGGLRENVKRAIQESEQDPAIRERRVENAALGVSRDRHNKLNQEAGAQARAQLEARRRREQGEDRQS